jgi:spore maturation protein CgeB
MKKLLHIGVNVGSESMPKYFDAQCEYSEMYLDKHLKANLQKLEDIPDTIFLQIQSDTIDGKNTCDFIGQEIKALRDKGVAVINWTGDKRQGVPRWMIDFSNYVSITGFSNEEDVEEARKYGINAIFLQQGVDIDIFTPHGDKTDAPEIVFLANNYGNQFPLSRFRREAATALHHKFGNRFKVYGNGWNNNFNSGNLNHSQYEESKLYRSSKISISISHFNNERYFSDRLSRSLCSGSFVLSHKFSGIEKDFEVGKHLETFESISEMLIKCEYWLNDLDEKRKTIAIQGCELASKEFSYENIVRQILEL